MGLRNNYYISSFFWSTFQKILNAVIGFISVPLLLGYFGKLDYGTLGIATACNSYMHLLDLGMDTGAVKFYSQWLQQGKKERIYRVARTNMTFYGIIAIINMAGLLALALWGESLFSVTHEQFLLLRTCLIIIATFSLFSWGTTTFNQLLVADMQMAFTMQVQSILAVLKGLLIGLVFLFHLSLVQYFFLLTAIMSMLIVPYAIKCKKIGIIDSLRPAFYWNDIKVVILFSLSIFALSLFQMTATQSRPIILSIFANDGASVVAEFRIIEVIPMLIIMICGTFSGIFLPKTSSMVARNDRTALKSFAYKWTRYTSVIVNMLVIPFILCSKEILSAYVGKEYDYLSLWLILWCVTVLIQMHTTPGNALVLAYGRTRLLVITTSIACIASVIINAFLAQSYGVGSSVISYLIYVFIVIGLYYIVYYKKLLDLSRRRMFSVFLKPTLLSFFILFIVNILPINIDSLKLEPNRFSFILICIIKIMAWIIPYIVLLFSMKLLTLSDFRK